VQLDGNTVVIKTKEGKEVRLHQDDTTKVVGAIKQDEPVKAKADEKQHILSLKSFTQSELNKTNTGKK